MIQQIISLLTGKGGKVIGSVATVAGVWFAFSSYISGIKEAEYNRGALDTKVKFEIELVKEKEKALNARDAAYKAQIESINQSNKEEKERLEGLIERIRQDAQDKVNRAAALEIKTNELNKQIEQVSISDDCSTFSDDVNSLLINATTTTDRSKTVNAIMGRVNAIREPKTKDNN